MRPGTSSPHFCRPLGTRGGHTAKRRSKNRRAPSPLYGESKALLFYKEQESMFSSTESVLRDKLSVILKVPSPFQVHARGREEEVEGCFSASDTSTHFSLTHRMKYVAQGFAESQTNPTETCKQKRVQRGLWREVRGPPSLAAPQTLHTPGVLQGGKTWIHAELTSAKDKRQAVNTGICSVQRVVGQPGFSPSSSLAHPWAQAWQAWAGAHSAPPCVVLGLRPADHCRPCPWPGHSAPRCSWPLCRQCRCRST